MSRRGRLRAMAVLGVVVLGGGPSPVAQAQPAGASAGSAASRAASGAPARCVAVRERCNGRDDDCDGALDEGFDVGAACTVGVGVCRQEGHRVCDASGRGAQCDAIAGTPSVERCGNAADDDCDGKTDEGFDVGTACAAGIGACRRPGRLICGAEGASAVCDAVPAAPTVELCGNGVDEDCDGRVDEGFDVGVACQTGVGACVRKGKQVCAPDRLGTVCDAVPGTPGLELCGNAIDEDCDGEPDEGYDVGAACQAGVGACLRDGHRVCAADRRGTICDARPGAPAVELCGSAADEDCDGELDEGFDVGTACAAGTGACRRPGQRVCTREGRGTVCDAVPAPPTAELCGNGVDDDCDDQLDEGFDTGVACAVGVGACRRTGKRVCAADGRGTVCDAQPGDPGVESCGNGVDDDCDGQLDEGFDVGTACQSGVGACVRSGRRVCAPDGRGTVCDARPGAPGDELCGNGVDEDCDGELDEGFDVGTACQAGVGACLRAGRRVCAADRRGTVCDARPGAPGPELCGSAVDEDCDGQVDEGYVLGASCFSAGLGVCRTEGQTICGADRRTTRCAAEPGRPGSELCGNGLDDDCDGQLDEGFEVGGVCVVGVGACLRQGHRICSADRQATSCDAQPGAPGVELCGNRIDDDCDGALDEGFAIGSECSAGVGACLRRGALVCAADQRGATCGAVPGPPAPERCGNRIDDDCDGQVDEGWEDRDGDGVACDNCPEIANITQGDQDGDGLGDACDPDTEMVLVPDQGKVTLGVEAGQGFPGEFPARSVQLPPYLIDRFEVSNRAYTRCVAAGTCFPPANPGSLTRPNYYGNTDFRDHPVVGVTWEQARMFCRWQGKRLPSVDEWEKAAAAGRAQPFPWGGQRTEIYPFAAPVPSCSQGNHRSLTGPDCEPGDTRPVGSSPAGASPYGVQDMAGNVWEWTADSGASSLATVDAEQTLADGRAQGVVSGGQERLIKGGSFSSRPVQLRVSGSDLRDSTRPSAQIGFRCAKDVR